MTQYIDPKYKRDIAGKIAYTFPLGDVPAVTRRVTAVFNSDQTSYSVGMGGTAQAKMSLFSNDMVIDLESSYFQCEVALEISGASAQNPLGQYTYESIRPILQNGVQDLFRNFRVESYGKTTLEEIRLYNHVASKEAWLHGSRGSSQALDRLQLRGNCLSGTEAKALVTNVPNDMGKSIDGVKVAFQMSASGLLSNPKYFPLKYLSQIQLFWDFESPQVAFNQQLNYSLNAADWTSSDGVSRVPTAAVSTAQKVMQDAVGRVIPSNGKVDAGAATIQLAYTIKNLQFVADMVQMEPVFDLAMKKTIMDKDGMPYWFTTHEVQSDGFNGQNYTQRINKAVANAMRVFTKFQHNLQLNATEDSFKSEHFGLQQYQYRLGTVYYPRDPVSNHLRMYIEADKAANYARARSQYPASSVRKAIGSSFAYPKFNGVAGAATQVNNGVTSTSVSQCYYPDSNALPSQFLIGTSLMASPDAIISGVNTNNGHNLELYLVRYPATSQTLTRIPTSNSTRNDTQNQLIKINQTRNPTGTVQGGLPKQTRYAWAGQDAINVISMLEFTRVIVIRPNFNIEIRE